MKVSLPAQVLRLRRRGNRQIERRGRRRRHAHPAHRENRRNAAARIAAVIAQLDARHLAARIVHRNVHCKQSRIPAVHIRKLAAAHIHPAVGNISHQAAAEPVRHADRARLRSPVRMIYRVIHRDRPMPGAAQEGNSRKEIRRVQHQRRAVGGIKVRHIIRRIGRRHGEGMIRCGRIHNCGTGRRQPGSQRLTVETRLIPAIAVVPRAAIHRDGGVGTIQRRGFFHHHVLVVARDGDGRKTRTGRAAHRKNAGVPAPAAVIQVNARHRAARMRQRDVRRVYLGEPAVHIRQTQAPHIQPPVRRHRLPAAGKPVLRVETARVRRGIGMVHRVIDRHRPVAGRHQE